jgi:hypothetical protein
MKMAKANNRSGKQWRENKNENRALGNKHARWRVAMASRHPR